ncbi:MAG TPA: glutathione S-transferase family protein [Caulobacteraceae bacterium]|jgi:glutathione S-transferase
MSLTLYYHPLSSFCWKALIALYETGTEFEPVVVNFGDEASAAAFKAVWPIGKFPVLRDGASGEVVPESTIIIEWLAQRSSAGAALIPADPQRALRVRRADRFYDLHVHMQMQAIVGDRLRPEGARDPLGVEKARALMATALGMAERDLAGREWTAGEEFSMADCAAAPALFYADKVAPLAPAHPNLVAYLERLKARPSFARVLEEAGPYFRFFPEEPAD